MLCVVGTSDMGKMCGRSLWLLLEHRPLAAPICHPSFPEQLPSKPELESPLLTASPLLIAWVAWKPARSFTSSCESF